MPVRLRTPEGLAEPACHTDARKLLLEHGQPAGLVVFRVESDRVLFATRPEYDGSAVPRRKAKTAWLWRSTDGLRIKICDGWGV